MVVHQLNLPVTAENIRSLNPGDKVLLSGVIYTARDKAHQRLIELLQSQDQVELPLAETALFYCGPSPVPQGKRCGAIGPTTSARMDKYTRPLIEAGLKVMIGKGERGAETAAEIRRQGAVYLACPGGVSAVLAPCIVSCETFLWEDLGTEAVYKLEVKDLPCFVAIV